MPDATHSKHYLALDLGAESGRAILAANSALFTLDWNVRGLPLLG